MSAEEASSTFEGLPMFLTTKQFATLTGTHEGTVRRGIREGRIPGERVNGRWLISKELAFPKTSERVSHGMQNLVA